MAGASETESREIKTCASVYDVRTIPPGRTDKQDTIAVALDHQSGYSVMVYFPYYFDSKGQLCVEAPFASKGEGTVFANGPAFTTTLGP
jgi:hypothetical protein